MKMKQDKYDEIRDGIRTIVDCFGPRTIGRLVEQNGRTAIMWRLFNKMWFDFQYTDSHPGFRGGEIRILPHKNHYWLNDLYDSGLNDGHIATALRSIATELGI